MIQTFYRRAFDENLIHSAAAHNNTNLLGRLLKHNRRRRLALVNQTNDGRDTPLLLEGLKGHTPCVLLLIAAGAWLDMYYAEFSILHIAALTLDSEMTEILILAGAHKEETGFMSPTPLTMLKGMQKARGGAGAKERNQRAKMIKKLKALGGNDWWIQTDVPYSEVRVGHVDH